MGSLANLYISQSYTSLIHLGSDSPATTNLVELQDGLGNGLGIFVNTNGDVTIDGALIVSGTFDIEGKIIVNDNVIVNGNLSVNGGTSLTGSLAVTQNITASNAFVQNDLSVGGTLFASKVVTLIESSSIIYSSGSNILGDAVSDTQTLIGSVIMSGSNSLTGSMGITNNLNVIGNISASTISGIGNVTSYSTSVDSRLDLVEATASFLNTTFSTSVNARLNVVEATASLYIPFSTSVDSRLDLVEATASFLNTTFSTSVDSRLDVVEASASLFVPFSTSVDSRLDLVEATASYLNTTFSASVDTRLDALETFSSSISTNLVTQAQLAAATGSLINQIDTKLNTSSFNAYTQSADAALNALSQSVSSSSGITNARIDSLSAKTGSYATTGSNNFVGNQTIVGSSVFSGSVSGLVIPLTISSQTASMDCSLGNFFTLTLPSGSSTFINPTNIKPGSTLSLRITQAAAGTGGTVGYSTNIKFPAAFPYIVTPTNGAIDILSFQSYDSSTLFGVAVNTMI